MNKHFLKRDPFNILGLHLRESIVLSAGLMGRRWEKFILIEHLIFKYLQLFKKDFTHPFLERGDGREKEREININVWLPLTCPPTRDLATTQACTLTGNQTSDPLVRRPAPNPLSHTSQGTAVFFLTS